MSHADCASPSSFFYPFLLLPPLTPFLPHYESIRQSQSILAQMQGSSLAVGCFLRRLYRRFPLVSYFGYSHLVGDPEFLVPPVQSSMEMTATIFKIANNFVQEAKCFTFVIPLIIRIETIQLVSNVESDVKSRDTLNTYLCNRYDKRITIFQSTKSFGF